MDRRGKRALPALGTLVLLVGCEPAATPGPRASGPSPIPEVAEEPSPPFRSIETSTAYVGDAACRECHAEPAAAYAVHAMARSFHRWTPDTRIEAALDAPLRHAPTGFHYAVLEEDGALYQQETVLGPDGRPLHELTHRMDWVMGSGNVARTYFTEENGRLFQLPLTWYGEGGWDFSPGYEVNNARFDRLMPDRCIACHGTYPEPIPFLEGKYADLGPGIGCERCHGPGALHVAEREAGAPPDSAFDDTIVNPARLSFERRLDVCEQCHVHTPVTVLREGRDAFRYVPSEPLREHAAFFKASGSIDLVSHADRLRQSACFRVTRPTEAPLECATCHDPHGPPPDPALRNEPCVGCHEPGGLEARLAGSDAVANHRPESDCVSCHMPGVKERTVPHGTFTDHWIRVVDADAAPATAGGAGEGPIEAYFERDRTGPEAAIYRALGEVVYATLATDGGLLASAAASLERALGADTTRADALFLLGLAYRQLGRTAEAIPALERSLRAEPDRPLRLHALARAYEGAGRDPAAIGELYERALALQPALALVRADYADFLDAQGRADEAIAAYRAALAERPGLAVAAFNLGAVLAGRGRLAESAEAFREALRRNPSLAEALSPLIQVRARGTVVANVRVMGSPVGRLPVRSRGPSAVRLDVAAGPPGLRFVNVPPGASVRILEPDGALVRTLPPQSTPVVVWDLRTDAGAPIGGGLHQVQVVGPEGFPPQRFFFGVVRQSG